MKQTYFTRLSTPQECEELLQNLQKQKMIIERKIAYLQLTIEQQTQKWEGLLKKRKYPEANIERYNEIIIKLPEDSAAAEEYKDRLIAVTYKLHALDRKIAAVGPSSLLMKTMELDGLLLSLGITGDYIKNVSKRMEELRGQEEEEIL